MTEKVGPGDHGDVFHNEKDIAEDAMPDRNGSVGRRKSVALNIVENPLKVSFLPRSVGPSD